MDGMLHLAADASPTTGFLGILYAEDFDEPPPAEAQPDAPPPPPPALTQHDVDAACAEAVAQARLEWEASAAEQRLGLLGALRGTLADAAADASAAARTVANGTVGTILATLMGALPHFCRDHGPAEAQALLDRLLPLLRAQPKVTIRVHPDLVATLGPDIAELQADFAGILALTPAPIGRGDLRVTWENGSLVRDADQIQRAMHEALSQLGLLAPTEITPKRSLTHAE